MEVRREVSSWRGVGRGGVLAIWVCFEGMAGVRPLGAGVNSWKWIVWLGLNWEGEVYLNGLVGDNVVVETGREDHCA